MILTYECNLNFSGIRACAGYRFVSQIFVPACVLWRCLKCLLFHRCRSHSQKSY